MSRALLPLAALCLAACAQQVVVYPDAGSSGTTDADVPDGAAADTGATAIDSGAGGMDASVVEDGGDVDDVGFHDAGGPLCYGDPFDVCEDPAESEDRNDEWIDADRYDSSAGCLSGDEITVLMGSKPARMCPTDRADYYNLIIVPCDSITLRMQVRLRMLDACPADRYDLELRFGGGIRECGTEFDGQIIQCSEENGDRIIQLLIPPGNSVQSWYFAVLTSADDVQFDYDLEVSIR